MSFFLNVTTGIQQQQRGDTHVRTYALNLGNLMRWWRQFSNWMINGVSHFPATGSIIHDAWCMMMMHDMMRRKAILNIIDGGDRLLKVVWWCCLWVFCAAFFRNPQTILVYDIVVQQVQQQEESRTWKTRKEEVHCIPGRRVFLLLYNNWQQLQACSCLLYACTVSWVPL